MPRIQDGFLDCVLYLYHSVEEAERGEQAGGSGFLVFIPVPGNESSHWPYAVTNWHVAKSAPIIRINKADGTTRIFQFTPDDWVPHQDKLTDLAVVNLDLETAADYKLTSLLPSMHFITRDRIDEYRIGVGDDTVLVGRFINRDGVQRNLPSVRAGIIAQMPDPNDPIDTEAGPQEAYLVETRSIAGFSGSPVFVWIPSSRFYKDVRKMGNRELDALMFLGIDCAHVPDYQPVVRWIAKCQKLIETGDNVVLNTGMAIVIPAYKLGELLMKNPELKAQREKEMIERGQKPPPGKLDIAGRKKKPGSRDIEVSEHPDRGRFFDDLGKAIRKRER